jgi:ribonucleoside-diphosphate reductase alpha chain
VNVPDAFMEAVCADVPYPLKSPKDGSVKGEVSARAIFADILDVRMQTGEPYLNFIDTVNRYLPQYQKDLGLQVKTSNLCTEISLVTGRDIYGKQRTAVCCLSSINAEKWDEYKDSFLDLMKDVLRFLDLVLQDYIETASPEQANAVYSAMRERAVGLGVMGFHSYLQSKNIPFESAMAKSFNKMLFTKMRAYADLISKEMAIKYGACPDAADGGVLERFSHKLAIAPTASISIIAGGCSPCVEPWIANVFIQKTLSGSMVVKNKYLQRLLESKGLSPEDIEDVWLSVLDKNGSVQHLDILDEYEKGVYKTAFEIDSVWVLEFAADRAKSVCQAQSINLFLSPSIHKRDLLLLHIRAWQMGIKSLYYLRSLAISRAGIVGSGSVSEDNTLEKSKVHVNVIPVVDPLRKYETCVACE